MPTHLINWRHNRERLILPTFVLPPAYTVNASDSARMDGLLDTGATGTGIRRDLADRLGLMPKGNRRVLTANGFLMADEFVFRVGFVIGDYRDPGFDPGRELPFVLDREILGFELQAGFPYALLIGMDIIGGGDLTVRSNGEASFAL